MLRLIHLCPRPLIMKLIYLFLILIRRKLRGLSLQTLVAHRKKAIVILQGALECHRSLRLKRRSLDSRPKRTRMFFWADNLWISVSQIWGFNLKALEGQSSDHRAAWGALTTFLNWDLKVSTKAQPHQMSIHHQGIKNYRYLKQIIIWIPLQLRIKRWETEANLEALRIWI